MTENFQCITCKHKFHVPKHRMVIDSENDKIKKQYKLPNGKPLTCPILDCGKLAEPIDLDFQGFPELGRFTMLPISERQASLKARSKRHAKTLKEEIRYKEQNNLY